MTSQVYVVGRYIKETEEGSVWDIQGVYEDEEIAKNACKGWNWFYGPMTINMTLSDESVVWPGLVYPKADNV